VIGGYAELMEGGLVTQEDVPRFSGIIRRESECMRVLIDDVLVLSRLEEDGADAERVPLAGTCLRVVERLRPAAEVKGILLLADLSDGAAVLGNLAMAEQMAYNLVDNAIKHSPEGGTVSVSIASSGNVVTLSIADEGPGVPDELKERVFERFFRADPSRSRETGGTGLGLAIVKHAAESMGGTVRVEDAPGGGAVFVVCLPRLT
jgi:two-component system phosphate regulon sensor histidine kinase PhoR